MKKVSISIISSLEKFFKEDKPCLAINKATALKNETYNFQVAIVSGEAMENVTLGISGLNPSAVRVFDVGFIVGTSAWMEFQDDYYVSKEVREYPELLTAHEDGFSLVAGETKCVFISVDCSALSVGTHEIRVVCSGEEATLSLTVLPCELVKNDLILTNWIHVDCICDQHGVEPFSDAFYAIFEKYLAWHVELGNNTAFTPIFTPPIDTAIGGERRTVQLVDVYVKDGKYSFGFEKLKQFIRFCSARGIVYFEFSQLFTQWGAKSCPKIVANTDEGEKKIFGWETDAECEEYKVFLGAFLPALRDEVYALNLQDNVFLHISDEPKEDAFARYKNLATFVREQARGLKILDTFSDVEFYKEGLVDIAAVTTKFAETFINEGLPCILYYCSVEFDGYLSNRFFWMPLQRTRVLGCQLYENNALGFLHWGFNFYYNYLSKAKINPYEITDAQGYFPSGDAYLVYPTENGVTPSIRLMTMKEAFQDYRALKTLEALTDKAFVKSFLNGEGVRGLKEYPRSLEWHLAFREKLNALIMENSKK